MPPRSTPEFSSLLNTIDTGFCFGSPARTFHQTEDCLRASTTDGALGKPEVCVGVWGKFTIQSAFHGIRLRELLGVCLLVVLFALAGPSFQPSRHTSGPILQVPGRAVPQSGIIVTPDHVPKPEY
jgi:hypothetical protein